MSAEYETLKMTASAEAGSFVKTLQGATGVGFQEGTHVHKDWYAKTIGFDQAMELAENAAREREDLLPAVEDIHPKVNADGQFVFEIREREFVPTDHALEQFAIRVGVPSSSVMRELRAMEGSDEVDADVMVRLAKNALRKVQVGKVFRLRTYTDGTCRAFVTEKYAPVDNRWYLEVLQEFLPSARLSHWRGDEDSMYGNLILPDSVMDYSQSEDSDYGGMLSVGNCEIGTRVVSQRPSLFRSICMNGCIWGEVKGKRNKRRHVGVINLHSLKTEIGENIALQLPLLETGVHKFLETQRLEIAATCAPIAVIGAICQEFKIGKTESKLVAAKWEAHESHQRNLFGVLNAITRAGQELSNNQWVQFDEVGGALVGMQSDRWYSLLNKANTFTAEDFTKIFGTVAV